MIIYGDIAGNVYFGNGGTNQRFYDILRTFDMCFWGVFQKKT